MKPDLIWSPQARDDLMEIYLAIGIHNPAAAERIYSTIEDYVALLIDHLGVRRPEIAPSARMLVEKSYVILYETQPDTDYDLVKVVEIVRVLHGHRDLSNVF